MALSIRIVALASVAAVILPVANDAFSTLTVGLTTER